MIRRDYILRLVSEMTQVLLRVVSLRYRQEHEQALKELDEALGRVGDVPELSGGPPEAELDAWVVLCQKQDQEVTAGLMLAVARLWRERGELQSLRNQDEATKRCRILALGLLLEAVLSQHAIVSGELLDEIEDLCRQTAGVGQPGTVLRRLMLYFEARGQFARGEDALFEWLEVAKDKTEAISAGKGFYERLLALPDGDLERGNLPRTEVESARQELLRLPAASSDA
jgi:hypothetical protein